MKKGIVILLVLISTISYGQEFVDKWKSSLIQQSGDDELIDIAVSSTGRVASISRSFEQNGDSGDENEIRIDYHESDGTLDWSSTDVVGDGIPVRVFIDGGDLMGVSNFDIGQVNSGVTFHGYSLSGSRKTGYPRSYSTTGGVVANDATIVNGTIHAVGYRNVSSNNKDMILIRSSLSNTSGTVNTSLYGDTGEDEIGRAVCALEFHSVALVEDGDAMKALKFGNNILIDTPEEERSFTVTNAVYGDVVGIKALDEDNVFAVFEEDGDYILKKYDMLSSFSGEFATRITDLSDVRDFTVDESGNTYLTGYDGLKLFLAKYNSSGVRQYLVYGSPAIGSSGSSVFVNDDGNIAIAGRLNESSISSPGVIIFDTDGQEILTYQYDENTGTAPILKGKQGPKNSVVIAGDYNSNNKRRKLWSICDLPQASFSNENPIIQVGGSVLISLTKESGVTAQWDHNSSFGDALFTEPGNYTASVSYSGTQFSCDNTISVLVRAEQNISFSSLSSKSTLDSDFALSASSTSGLSIEYASSNTDVATITNGVVSIVGAGTTTITASQAGTELYVEADDVSRTLTVNKASQTLDFTLSSPVTITQAHLDEPSNDRLILKSNIQSSEGNNATTLVSSDPTVVTVSDDGTWLLDYRKAGTVTLTATVAEDETYLGTSDQVTFSLVKTSQGITFSTGITERFLGEDPFSVNATIGGSPGNNSGNTIVTTSDDPTVVSISGETVTVEGIGTTTIRANLDGNELYDDAPEQTIDITVDRATFTWNGATWGNSNRVTRDHPLGEDIAVVQSPYITTDDGEFNAYSLEVKSSAFLRVSPGHSLEVMTDIVVDGEMIISSGASLITYEGNNVADDISINRNTRYEDGRYSFVGSPVEQSSTVTGSDLGTNVYKYNETTSYTPNDGLSRWEDASNDELIPGAGYTQANELDITFTGTPNTGTIPYSGTYTGTYNDGTNEATEGWNLVSNPYPAAINVTSFLNGNPNIEGAVYFWDDNGSDSQRGTNDDYVAANGTVAINTTVAGGHAIYNQHIGSAQAFFVKLEDDTNTDILFTETMRRTGNNEDGAFYRKENPSFVRLNLTDNFGLFKQSIVGWMSNISDNQVDRSFDARIFSADAPYAIYTFKNEQPLAIQGVSDRGRNVEVGFNVAEGGTYTIGIESDDYKGTSLYLIDKKTNEVTDLLSANYQFTTEPGHIADRFMLTESNTILGTDQLLPSMYVYNNVLHLGKTENVQELKIFNLSGTLMMNVQVDSDQLDLNHLKTGIYLVTRGSKSQKISIK